MSASAAVGNSTNRVPVEVTPEQRCVYNWLYPPLRRGAAFTLIEVMMGTVATTIMLVSLYAGFTFGFREIRIAEQEARATQILEEKMELVRLLTWDQVVNLPGYVPSSFTDSFYANNPTNTAFGNLVYTGSVSIANAPITETYKNDMRMINVSVTWTWGKKTHTRSMSTFVSQYGMQKYVY